MSKWIEPKNYLRPCPFCGGKAKMLIAGGGDRYMAFCPECGAEVPSWAGTEEGAAKTWNAGATDVWISVKDRLPEKSGDYLVCSVHNGKALPRSVYFDTSAGWYDSAITHWMPLPEPPKESEVESDA